MNTTAPTGFTERNWERDEPNIAPRDRFELYDGPSSGGVSSRWQSDWGTELSLDGYDRLHPLDGLDIPIESARALRDDLTAVLDQIEGGGQ